MKITSIQGFELYEQFMDAVYDFFEYKDLQYHKITQENNGSQKFIKIELSIKVD